MNIRYFLFLGLALLLIVGFFSLPSRAEEKPVVEMETSMGTIAIELYPDKAPETIKNFLAYVDSGFYNGTIFHRVIRNFMIQGGGLMPDLTRKSTKPPIKNEANNKLSNKRGTIAMARTGEINSATAQFFINVQDNQPLDYHGDSPDAYGYAVFGKVISGMDVVDKIRNVKTASKQGYDDVPVEAVLIKSIKRKTVP
ncbi:MAG: peptidyl-prolyl cis-trans isomerase [Acidobacteria bacterium]|nr:peptidyl-prolyl cis-trans isomerase [Acidobacteriota bacterium]